MDQGQTTGIGHHLHTHPLKLQSGGAPSKAAELAEAQKKNKYSTFSFSHHFTPVAIESLGPWGPETNIFFNEVGKRQKEIFKSNVAGAYLRQRISLELQRGNAHCVLFSIRNYKPTPLGI